MAIVKNFFGRTKDNVDVYIFTLTNSNGFSAKIMTYGATVVSIIAPDKNSNLDDVVLGYDNITSYENGDKYFGALIGRCANRIEYGKFKINDKEYSLAKNNGNNHLHGGIKGFDKVVWNVETIDCENNLLKLSYFSKNGEEGYPGNLNVTVTYTIAEDNSLIIHYEAISDKDTIVNLTNHSYFNLSGHPDSSVLNHKLIINSNKFTPNDKYSIPTGEIADVAGTPMDFKAFKIIGKEIDSGYEQTKLGLGYDHNWILNSNGNIDKIAAKLIDEESSRALEVYTTNPAIQVYSSNFLDGSDIGKEGIHYNKRSAICLETQCIPNAINSISFDSPILKCSEKYSNTTIYKFSIL